jgi:hypothetical protein
MLNCGEIVEEMILQDGENYDNFLRADQLNEDKMMMIKSALHGKKEDIWKPSRYEFPKHIRQLIMSERDGDHKRHTLQEILRKY